jgi:hypothetical protein
MPLAEGSQDRDSSLELLPYDPDKKRNQQISDEVHRSSVLPSANGAAISMLDAYVAGLGNHDTAIMPDQLPVRSRSPGASKEDNNVLTHSVRTSNHPITAQMTTCSGDPGFYRYQTLNVYQFNFEQEHWNERSFGPYISLITSCVSLALTAVAAVLWNVRYSRSAIKRSIM